MTITTQHNQSLIDIAIQHTGSIETIFYILEANPSMQIDSQPPPGTKIEIPEAAISAGNALVKGFYADNYIVPASAVEIDNSGIELIGDNEGYIGDNKGYI